LINEIEKSPLAKPKSEFETKEQYEARVERFLNHHSPLLFVLGVDKGDPPDSPYPYDLPGASAY
jgi:hypothetical protein